MYITVSIGNSDDKLSQIEWCRFVRDIDYQITHFGKVHFHGGPPNWQAWQNTAWIAEIAPEVIDDLVAEIKRVREVYKQDSAFVMIAEGRFI